MDTVNKPKASENRTAVMPARGPLVKNIERSISEHLMQKYGPLLDARALAETLKFPSVDALERSLERGHLRVPLRQMPHRRGTFALAHQVAHYLAGANEQNFQDSAETADLGKERPK